MPWLCPLRVRTSLVARTYTIELARLSAKPADKRGMIHRKGLR